MKLLDLEHEAPPPTTGAPETGQPTVLEHGARPGHRAEPALAKLGVGRKGRAIGVLEIGVAGRKQANPVGVGR